MNKIIEVNNKKFIDFKQNDYKGNTFFNKDFSLTGCGPCALSSVISGYNNNINPLDVAKIMEYGSFKRIIETANYYNFKSELIYFNSLDYTDSLYSDTFKKVFEHLKNGNQVIVLVKSVSSILKKLPNVNHFIAVVGIVNDILIISNPSSCDEVYLTLDELMKNYMSGGRKGFLLLRKD